jgi:hypothetical protein
MREAGGFTVMRRFQDQEQLQILRRRAPQDDSLRLFCMNTTFEV